MHMVDIVEPGVGIAPAVVAAHSSAATAHAASARLQEVS